MHKTRACVTSRVLSLLHTNVFTRCIGRGECSLTVLHMCLAFGMRFPMLFLRDLSTRRIELLLRYNTDVNYKDGFLIRSAAWANNLETVILLIKAGADVNLCGMYMPAMSAALTWASHTVVSHLLLAGAILPDNALALAYSSQISSAEKVECVSRAQRKAAKNKG